MVAGIPLYSSSAGAVPIAGTSLKKVFRLKLQLILIFTGITASGIVLVEYVMNFMF